MPNGGFITFYDLSAFGFSWPPPAGQSFYGPYYNNTTLTIPAGGTVPTYSVPVDDDDPLFEPDTYGGASSDPTGQTYGAGTPIGNPGDPIEGNGSYLGVTITNASGVTVEFNWVLEGGNAYLQSEDVPAGFFDGPQVFRVLSTKVPTESEYAVCFARGTLIKTPRGEVAVEDLAVGDKVVTMDNGLQPIRWVGGQTVRAEGRLAPVRIKAGTLGASEDLWVSPLHRMLLSDANTQILFGTEEVLVSAKSLINDDTITRQRGGTVDYFHIMFDAHQIVFANGCATESFYPGATALSALESEIIAEIYEIFPSLVVESVGYGPLSRKELKDFEADLVSVA